MHATDNTAVIAFPTGADQSAPGASATGYANVRFNALKHGVLSRYVVLSHEDRSEYEALLTALAEEHKPVGPTEAHLVEELAGTMWRQRRVLQAEGANINRGLKSTVAEAERLVPTAAPFELGLSGKHVDIRDVVGQSPDEAAASQRDARHDLESTQRARAILRRAGTNAYERAMRALRPDSRDWWLDYVGDGSYEATAAGLSAFIDEHLYPICLSMEREAHHHGAIKNQVLGEGLQAHRLEKLNRYEVHLDRKFERTLAMLLKLKELRRGGA